MTKSRVQSVESNSISLPSCLSLCLCVSVVKSSGVSRWNIRSHEFLKALLETPSPSGFEQQIQQVVRTYAKPFADDVRTDAHGNVFAVRFAESREGSPRIMLAGHCDQIGLMVQYIDSDGFLYIQPIGGWDMQILLGQHLTVWSKISDRFTASSRGGPFTSSNRMSGVRCRTSPMSGWTSARRTRRKRNRSCAAATRSRSRSATGRSATTSPSSPAMDDKVGLWVCMEAVRRCCTADR